MRNHSDIFYAKILLFGEYSVLLNSMGLSIPYTHFCGEFSFIGEDKYTDLAYAKRSNHELKKYLEFLRKEKNVFSPLLKIDEFAEDIQAGLYFESTIPESYGLGSSGALCAATYKRYAHYSIDEKGKLGKEEVVALKNILARLESGFHGKSSGLDPLNSYLKSPLLIKNKEEIELVTLPGDKLVNDSAIFLLDTKQIGNTAPLVQNFLLKCNSPEYSCLMEEVLIPLNNECINELIKGGVDSFFSNVKKLSAFQILHFRDMIPENYRKLWSQGLDEDRYYLKLCGSGGGGFLLGFTQDYTATKAFFERKECSIIPVYHQEK